jgi:hypothetical protein
VSSITWIRVFTIEHFISPEKSILQLYALFYNGLDRWLSYFEKNSWISPLWDKTGGFPSLVILGGVPLIGRTDGKSGDILLHLSLYFSLQK